MRFDTYLKTASKAAILAGTSAVLIGCGGGGGSNTSTQDTPSTPPPVATFDVSGTVSGLAGEVVIVVNGVSSTQDVDGGFEFRNVVESGDDVTLSLSSDPFGQTCAITGSTTRSNVTSDVTGIVVDCINIPVVNTSVKNFFTGEVVDTAEVTLSRQDNGEIITESVSVDSEGVAAFEVPLSSGRLSLSTDPVGFGAQSIILQTPNEAVLTEADIFVQPADMNMTFNNAAGGDVVVDGESLATLPANGFVDSNGNQVVGDINLELTVIDPSQSSALMPGDFLAQDPTSSEISQIESFGALDMTFETASGEPVQLAEGETATLRIPVADRVSSGAPSTMPLYFFDEETGFWVEEGEADLITLDSGELAYEGTVSHFTTWNADRRSETVNATGCVVDSEGQPFAGVNIRSEGVNYIGSSSAVSDSQGVFTIPVRVNSSQRYSATRGLQSRTLVLLSGDEDFTFADAADPTSCLVVGNAVVGVGSASITLTWGENPRDLDTHFFGLPEVETEENFPFEVYFGNRNVTVNNQTIFLDVDDTSSFGPEILTVPNFPYEGVYSYGVNLFSGSGTIASSPARVEVNLGGDVIVYGPPEGEPTECWAVMRFIVDGAGNVTRETIGTWEGDNFCDSGVLSSEGSQKTSAESVRPKRVKPAPTEFDSK